MMNYFDENFVIALCFIIFIYLAYRPLKKSVMKFFDTRISEITHKLTEAEKIKKDATAILEEVRQEMSNFEEHEKAIIKNSEIVTKKLIDTRKKEIELMFDRTKDSAIKSIETYQLKVTNNMKKDLMKSVLETVHSYLDKTKNNSVSDKEILDNLLSK